MRPSLSIHISKLGGRGEGGGGQGFCMRGVLGNRVGSGRPEVQAARETPGKGGGAGRCVQTDAFLSFAPACPGQRGRGRGRAREERMEGGRPYSDQKEAGDGEDDD